MCIICRTTQDRDPLFSVSFFSPPETQKCVLLLSVLGSTYLIPQRGGINLELKPLQAGSSWVKEGCPCLPRVVGVPHGECPVEKGLGLWFAQTGFFVKLLWKRPPEPF